MEFPLLSKLQHWISDLPAKLFWIKRAPEPGTVILNQKRIYTVPSKSGWMLVLVLLILFVTSTNYNLNLGFILTFTIAGIAFVSVFQGFANLASLELEPVSAENTFAGDSSTVRLRIRNPGKRARYAIWIGWRHAPEQKQAYDIPPESDIIVELELLTSARGRCQIPIVTLNTWFPLGLLRAWSYWYPGMQAIVYPAPEAVTPQIPLSGDGENESTAVASGGDFSGIRPYRPGDSLKHLAWKQIARLNPDSSNALLTKEYVQHTGGETVLDLQSLLHALATEQALSRVAAWILQLEKHNMAYGLHTGDLHIPASAGDEHARRCLEILALYGERS